MSVFKQFVYIGATVCRAMSLVRDTTWKAARTREMEVGLIPPNIFTYWGSLHRPDVVDACFDQVKRLNPRWDLRVLQPGLTDLEPPPVDNLDSQHLADWYRLAALEKYGGVWMDASSIYLRPMEAWVNSSNAALQGFLFMLDNETMDSFALATPPKTPFMKCWLGEFRKALQNGMQQYSDAAPESVLTPGLNASLPYLTIHLSWRICRAQLPDAPVHQINAHDSGGPREFTWKLAQSVDNWCEFGHYFCWPVKSDCHCWPVSDECQSKRRLSCSRNAIDILFGMQETQFLELFPRTAFFKLNGYERKAVGDPIATRYGCDSFLAKLLRPADFAKSCPQKYVKQNEQVDVARTVMLAGFVSLCLVIAGIVCITLWWSARGHDSLSPGDQVVRSASDISLLCCFLDNVSFTLLLLDALALAKALGAGAAISGLTLGMHKIGSAFGGLGLWCGLRADPDLWRKGKPLLIGCALLQLVGTSIAAAMGVVIANRESHGSTHQNQLWTFIAVILMARFMTGLGGGITQVLTQNQFGRMTAAQQRPLQMMRFYLANTFGLGMGPVLGAFAKELITWGTANSLSAATAVPPQDYVVTLVCGLAPPSTALIFLLSYPSLVDALDMQAADQMLNAAARNHQTTSFIQQEENRKKRIVVGCLLLHVLRAFAIASAEAATSMILDTIYHWDPVHIGLSTGSVFFLCWPVNLLYGFAKDKLSPAAWLRILVGLPLVAAFGLMPYPVPVAWQLLISTMILFPALYMSGGLILGFLQCNVLPEGGWLDLKTSTLLTHLGAEILGRGLGPPLARWGVALGGQRAYAQQQICVSLGAWLATEFVLRLDESRPDASKHQK